MTDSQEVFYNVPFNAPLYDLGGKYTTTFIGGLRGNEEKIVRILPENGTPENYRNLSKKCKKMYQELTQRGINVIGFDFVIGNEPFTAERKPALFVIADKVNGVELDKLEPTDVNLSLFLGQLKSLFTNLIDYHFDLAISGKEYLADIHSSEQYMFGKKKGDFQDRIYLVDIDPYTANSKDSEQFKYDINCILSDIEKFEVKFNISLSDIKKYFERRLLEYNNRNTQKATNSS